MTNKILIIAVLFSVITGTIARQCYKCTACPKPFKGNEAGVTTINVGDNNYCQKTIALGIESRDDGGTDCTPLDQFKFCCQGNLCNGATANTSSMQLLAAIVSLVVLKQWLH